MERMEFNNKLYNLRKKNGLSQEELASRLNVSRQTISKWEVGDSTPDMEKLIAISDLFDISLDELVMDKQPASNSDTSNKSDVIGDISKNVITDENKKKVKKGLKIAGIVFGIFLCIDVISMIVYFVVNGFPK